MATNMHTRNTASDIITWDWGDMDSFSRYNAVYSPSEAFNDKSLEEVKELILHNIKTVKTNKSIASVIRLALF